MDKKIQQYLDKQKSPQKEILRKVRDIFLKTLPSCGEEAAWGVIAFANKKFYLAAMKECVHVGFATNGLSEKEISQFEGSGKTMRHIKIKTLQDINERKLVNLIKLVNKKVKCESR